MRIVLAGGFNHLELAMNASNPARLSTDGLEPVPDTSTARKHIESTRVARPTCGMGIARRTVRTHTFRC